MNDINDIEALTRQKRMELRRLQRELERLEALKQKRLKVSSTEIRDLAKQIQLLAKDRMMETSEVIHLIQQAIEKYGLKGGRSGGTRGPVPPKYRNPNNPSETWTGRGRQPKWVTALLSQGYTLEQLKIQD
ncbi:MAG TPA: H-NS histone family protein [Sulfurivirga caldicuralii]|nr:H-NS histone family protein [Sulfurivirga caldicuralii]